MLPWSCPSFSVEGVDAVGSGRLRKNLVAKKVVTAPSASSPLTATPAGISSRSRTSPVSGSMRRSSLCSGLHGAMPELAVHPGDAGDEAIRFDRVQDSAFLGVDLVDLAGVVLADPKRPLDLPDPVVGELPQLADQPAALGIEGDDALAAGEPDVRAVEGHAVDVVHAGIGAVFAEDLRLPGLALERHCHDPILLDGQRAWE